MGKLVSREVIELYREMQVEPNEITIVDILSAYRHAGLVDEGFKYFDSMRNNNRIEPGIEHYGCLVYLLGRTGNLVRALKFVFSMRMKPDSAIWGSLLSSCRTRRNLEIAVIAVENLLELEPHDTGNLVLLANTHADLGKWDRVSRMRKFIRSKRIKKTPGCSLIEMNSTVQEFVSGDYSKPFLTEIYQIVHLLALHQNREEDWI